MTCTFIPVSLKGEQLVCSWRQTLDGLNRAFDTLKIDIPLTVGDVKFALPQATVYADLPQKKFIEMVAEAIEASVTDIDGIKVQFLDDLVMFKDPFDERITYRVKTSHNRTSMEINVSSKYKPIIIPDAGLISALDQYMDKEDISFGPGYAASENLILYSNTDNSVKNRIISSFSMCKTLDSGFQPFETDLKDITPNPLYAW